MTRRNHTAAKLDAVHRTYVLDQELKGAMGLRRVHKDQTLARFLMEATESHLPKIAEGLQALDIAPPAVNGRPARLPMDVRALEGLKVAAEATGIPATRLLAACIRRATQLQPQ